MIPSTNKPAYINDEFDDFFQRMMEEWNVPGASLAVIDGNEVYSKGYGVIRLDGPAVTEDTIFNAASMSKSFTAASVALLVDDKEKHPQVRWNTPASELIREDFVLCDAYCTQNVTLMDILCHRTGMAGNDDICLGVDAEVPSTPKSITRALRHLPISKPFRTVYQYNNLMFVAASYLVETVAGQPFAEILRSRFWEPLGMSRTYLGLTRTPKDRQNDSSNIAQGYYWDPELKTYFAELETNSPGGQGAGEIMSSAKDWGRWVHAMIHKTAAISDESWTALIRPQIRASDTELLMGPFQSPLFYGMGWCVEFYRGHKVVSHAGRVPGFTSLMLWLPERKWGVVVFGNAAGFSEASDVITWSLVEEVLRIPKHERTDWAKLRREMADKEKEEEEEKDQKVLFPDRPDPPLPMQLPLSAYTGRYRHPAYEFEVVIKDDHLFIDASDCCFPYLIAFEHVSGDYFIAVRQNIPQSEKWKARVEACFKVNGSGKVEKMGLDLLEDDDEEGEEDGNESEYVWFARVDDQNE